jgi:hypothetical protein
MKEFLDVLHCAGVRVNFSIMLTEVSPYTIELLPSNYYRVRVFSDV